VHLGGFILIADSTRMVRDTGRSQPVRVVIDTDQFRDTAILCVGSHIVRVESSLDEILGWLAVRSAR